MKILKQTPTEVLICRYGPVQRLGEFFAALLLMTWPFYIPVGVAWMTQDREHFFNKMLSPLTTQIDDPGILKLHCRRTDSSPPPQVTSPQVTSPPGTSPPGTSSQVTSSVNCETVRSRYYGLIQDASTLIPEVVDAELEESRASNDVTPIYRFILLNQAGQLIPINEFSQPKRHSQKVYWEKTENKLQKFLASRKQGITLTVSNDTSAILRLFLITLCVGIVIILLLTIYAIFQVGMVQFDRNGAVFLTITNRTVFGESKQEYSVDEIKTIWISGDQISGFRLQLTFTSGKSWILSTFAKEKRASALVATLQRLIAHRE